MIKRIIIIFAMFFLSIPDGYAAQIGFQSSYRQNYINFSYAWNDSHNKQYKAKFSLPIAGVQRGAGEFKRFSNKDMNRYIFEGVDRYVKQSYRNIDVKVKRSLGKGGFSLSAKGVDKSRFNDINTELNKQQNLLADKYIKLKLYTYLGDNDTIVPDHGSIAKSYVKAMRPVAEAIKRGAGYTSRRGITDHVLSFVQSIPYDTLENRYTSNGAGFQTPYGILLGNKGDCDSKSVLFASIMRNFLPKASMIMVYIPGHALIGFNFAHSAGDDSLMVGNKKYVLAEPVGPGLSKIGKVSEASRKALQAGNYYYKKI